MPQENTFVNIFEEALKGFVAAGAVVLFFGLVGFLVPDVARAPLVVTASVSASVWVMLSSATHKKPSWIFTAVFVVCCLVAIYSWSR